VVTAGLAGCERLPSEVAKEASPCECRPKGTDSARQCHFVGGLPTVAVRMMAMTCRRFSYAKLLLAALSLPLACVALVEGESSAVARPGVVAINHTRGARASSIPMPDENPNPFDEKTLANYLDHLRPQVTVAIENEHTGAEFTYHPSVELQTASIIKVDILATLLASQPHTATVLARDPDDISIATEMIEESDNDAATDLWDEEDGSTGVGAFNHRIGMSHTDLNDDGYWGISTTTAADQIVLLRQVFQPSKVLDPVDQSFMRGLMENTESGQRWGISAGTPNCTTVALKDGWVPIVDGDWEINSIGSVTGCGHDYLIAILTDRNPTETAGIGVVDAISTKLEAALAKLR
jgi:Beta-lactamase enzyme family